MKALFTILFSVILIITPCHASLKDAWDAASKNDFQNSFPEFKRLAESGDPMAQAALGFVYEGLVYKGSYIEQDLQKAFYWYKKAAEQGVPEAQGAIANLYLNGAGVKKSYKNAFYWQKKAAEQGYAESQFRLGKTYFEGKGVEASFKESLYWYEKAAEQDHRQAQLVLGAVFYNSGIGTSKDVVKAYHWLNLSAAGGNEKAIAILQLVENQMSPEQIRASQAMTRDYLSKKQQRYAQ